MEAIFLKAIWFVSKKLGAPLGRLLGLRVDYAVKESGEVENDDLPDLDIENKQTSDAVNIMVFIFVLVALLLFIALLAQLLCK